MKKNITHSKGAAFGLLIVLLIAGLCTSVQAEVSEISQVEVGDGVIQSIVENVISMDSTDFEPANEVVKLPEGTKVGDRVRVKFYRQNEVNYYIEIVKDGQIFADEDKTISKESRKR